MLYSDVERGAVQIQSEERDDEWSYESFQCGRRGPHHVTQENHTNIYDAIITFQCIHT